ncbi:MAG: hypothetical protein CBD21_02930 [bacterium TMED161]|nr:MAG: hypothetical protein CBD21_02930 [bacterium TMED161]|tara:strand:- start:402 stop:2000 length:1599 start_codon:yes stop_codon:yes gene_type:complete
MKTIFKVMMLYFFFSCAVQGPIPGGEVDESGPRLIKIFPENFSNDLLDEQNIILYFDEPINPNTLKNSFQISNSEFNVKAIGKKIIIRPKNKWDIKKALNINVNRSLSDYYNNSMDTPLSIYFSFGFDIPRGSVVGKLLEFSNLYNQNSNRASKSDLYEVGLYKLINNDKVLISKTQTDIELNFSFNALEDGNYFIIAVQNSIKNPPDDFIKNKFSVYNKNIEIDKNNLKYDIKLNIGLPVSKNEISAMNFINKYYVKYDLSDGSHLFGIIDTVYNNFDMDFSDITLSSQLELENEFEKYLTNSFDYVIPEINDTINPKIISCEFNDSFLSVYVSEPLVEFYSDSIFYQSSNDSINKFISGTFYEINSNPLNKSIINIPFSLEYENISHIYFIGRYIKDLSNNYMDDSFLDLKSCTGKSNLKNDDHYQGGDLSGSVYTSHDNQLVAIAYNKETGKSWETLILDNKYSFLNIPAGEYFLQIYEQYNTDSNKVSLRFFPGSWTPFIPSSDFSDYIGPIEVRKNWKINGVDINFE